MPRRVTIGSYTCDVSFSTREKIGDIRVWDSSGEVVAHLVFDFQRIWDQGTSVTKTAQEVTITFSRSKNRLVIEVRDPRGKICQGALVVEDYRR